MGASLAMELEVVGDGVVRKLIRETPTSFAPRGVLIACIYDSADQRSMLTSLTIQLRWHLRK